MINIDNDKMIKAQQEVELALRKLYSGEITHLWEYPAKYDISNKKEEFGIQFNSRPVKKHGYALKTTITGPDPLYNIDLDKFPSYYSSLRLWETTRGTLLDSTVSKVICLGDDKGLETPLYSYSANVSDTQSQKRESKTFQSYPVVVRLEILSSLLSQDVNSVIIRKHHEELMNLLTDKQNAMALMGSGINEPTGAFTVAASRHAGHQNRIEIPVGNNPKADASLNLDYLTKVLDKVNSTNPQAQKCSIHLNNTFAQTLKNNTLEKDLPANKHRVNELMHYGAQELGAIYKYLGYPVFSAPSLKPSLKAKAELGVGGDFSKFWVVMRPIEIRVLEHPQKAGYMIIQASQGMDSDLVDLSWDRDKPGPLFYIEGSDN